MRPKISVIIPVYNVEPYIRQCLDSVVNQTYKNLEIIIVDDGSPDNCPAICDEYAQRDERIRVIHKRNEGLSAAWNDGINETTGDWIMFVDSDDWIDSTFIDNMVSASDLDKMQVITAAHHIDTSVEGEKISDNFSESVSFYDGQGRDQMMLKSIEAFGKRFGVVWNRLYLKSFLISKSIFFDPKIPAGMPNDSVFNLEVFKKADNTQIVDCIGYHYRILNSASTLRYRPNRSELMVYPIEALQNLLADYPSETLKQMLDARILEFIFFNLIWDFFHPDNKEDYQTVVRRIREMKSNNPYKRVIYQADNTYLPWKAIILKYALRLSCIWPLKLLAKVYRVLKNA